MVSKEIGLENNSELFTPEIVAALLKDRTTGENIIWATDDYAVYGEEYTFKKQILFEQVTGDFINLIQPRVKKDKDAQTQRSRDKAEVFTPSWVCNAQNNLVDNAWFGKDGKRFNTETPNGWITNYYPIHFHDTEGKTWKDYVTANRLEISCGEAPYITSRYDTVTGEYISPRTRIGLLDRKLRVISENAANAANWLQWAEKAVKSVYGFDWQGDNVFLARQNVLLSVAEYYESIYGKTIKAERLLKFAEIISWNIWQMDGIKFVVPESCVAKKETQLSLFGEITTIEQCPGCKNDDRRAHTGVYAFIMDWETNKPVRFVDILKGGVGYGKV